MGVYVDSGSKYETAASTGESPLGHQAAAVASSPRSGTPKQCWLQGRLTPPYAAGVSHVLERLAFKATHNRTAFRVTREVCTATAPQILLLRRANNPTASLPRSCAHSDGIMSLLQAEVMGANLLASASREQMAYTVDVLRTHLPEATELLLDCVLNPKFELHTLNEALEKLKGEVEELEGNAQASLMEALHATAYEGGLGQPLVASPAALARLTPGALADFVAEHFTANRIAISAAGSSLQAVSAIAEPLLASLPSAPPPPSRTADGTYVGGDLRKALGASGDGLTHCALAFHFPGGWRDVKGATTMTVLQMLLGGGNSFSAGGPGKGMHSRLYTRVLNRHAWAHSCTGFHSLYNDTGLVGIHASCTPGKGAALVDTMVAELQAVASPGGISAAELARAKASTVSSVLMNLESRAVVAEDIGRQALTYGARKAPSTFLDEVNRLTDKDLAAAVNKLLKGAPPTFVALGDTAGLPRYDAIAKRFG